MIGRSSGVYCGALGRSTIALDDKHGMKLNVVAVRRQVARDFKRSLMCHVHDEEVSTDPLLFSKCGVRPKRRVRPRDNSLSPRFPADRYRGAHGRRHESLESWIARLSRPVLSGLRSESLLSPARGFRFSGGLPSERSKTSTHF